MFTRVKNQDEILAIRESGRMLATVLGVCRKNLVDGVTPIEIANIAASELKSLGGDPPFLGYGGFPNVICISINDEVVHGIPNDRILKAGDIVSCDFGVKYRGMITDSARTWVVPGSGENELVTELLNVTEQSLAAGIGVLRDGVRTGDIGFAIESVIKPHGFGIVRDLVGHGVGHELHESPDIPNYGRPGRGNTLRAGMTIAIEPMVTLGSEKVQVESDGWTITTVDGSLSAHFEHTILITNSGSEILTSDIA